MPRRHHCLPPDVGGTLPSGGKARLRPAASRRGGGCGAAHRDAGLHGGFGHEIGCAGRSGGCSRENRRTNRGLERQHAAITIADSRSWRWRALAKCCIAASSVACTIGLHGHARRLHLSSRGQRCLYLRQLRGIGACQFVSSLDRLHLALCRLGVLLEGLQDRGLVPLLRLLQSEGLTHRVEVVADGLLPGLN